LQNKTFWTKALFALPSGITSPPPPLPIEQEAGWASGPWLFQRRDKSVATCPDSNPGSSIS
jgi:hypothetical protein